MGSLDDVLEGKEPEVKEPEKPEPGGKNEAEPTPGTESEESEEKAEDEDKSKEDKSPREAAAEAQARSERQKRQQLQRELNDLRREIDGIKNPKKTPDPLEDAEGFSQSVEEKIQQARVQDRISMSQELMRERYEDYDDAEAEFIDLVNTDPSLREAMVNHPMPAKFVYETVKNRSKGSDETAELKAQLAQLTEMVTKLTSGGETTPESSDQPSLAGKRSSGTTDSVVDESLEDILGR